jgi:hypothetical protein
MVGDSPLRWETITPSDPLDAISNPLLEVIEFLLRVLLRHLGFHVGYIVFGT